MAAVVGIGAQSRYRLAQEREFYRYIPPENSTSQYAPFDRAGDDDFTPQPSADPALTSFAQLGALRLGSERVIISLFDQRYQHILAEATPTLSLVGGKVAAENERLLLGCCVFPKEKGVCHYVESSATRQLRGEEARANQSTLVALDMVQDERFDPSNMLGALTKVRFLIVMPIISPRGLQIGAYTVLDSRPRSSIPDQHTLQFLKDMAITVMDHLATKEATRRSHRAERMIVGLGSFVEGRTTLRDSWQEAVAEQEASEKSGEPAEGNLNMEQQDIQELTREVGQNLTIREPSIDSKDTSSLRPKSSGSSSTQPTTHREHQTRKSGIAKISKTTPLPSSIRNIFSRAANLLRESIGAEGVMFLDANSRRFGGLVNQNKRKVADAGPQGTSGSSSDDSSGSGSSSRAMSETDQDSDFETPRVSECLGFSSSKLSSIDNEEEAGRSILVPEPMFTSLIRRYPHGKIFTYNAQGSVSEDSDSASQKDSGPSEDTPVSARGARSSSSRRVKPGFKKHADDLIKIFAGARSILILPIWDSDRSRYFAGMLVWTNEPDRLFTFENELVFASAFTHSIMAEIRRADVEVAEKAKTNLVSSITHELRNPLHGILGTADILSDTAMNALQHGMVHTIESCGRTLLDTINSLLDLTFIDQYRKGDTSQPRGRKKKRGLPRSLPLGGKSTSSNIELDAVLEEVTECVFAGYCFYNHPQAPPPALTSSSSRTAGQTKKADPVGPRASQVTIIFDIEPDSEWHFHTHAGAWRRILMNVFGNALKYTPSGYIYLGLASHYSTDSKQPGKKHDGRFQVTITVKDTGKGIGSDYLQNDLFSPFKQEDPLASGSGLGLSIVRKAVGFLGGSIEIESTKGIGTQISIHTPLNTSTGTSEDSSSRSIFASVRRYTEAKKIAILGFGQTLLSQRDTVLYSSLERMCRHWFGLEVTNLSPLEGKHTPFDYYLAVQTELDCEDVGGRNIFELSEHFETGDSCSSPVVVICQSPEEAHRMFVASKSRDQNTLFEFVSQPCGPRKLARALDMCIKRQRDEEQGRHESDEPTRWVEMPESSHLPVDVGPSDPPEDRMKISKRPTTDTMGTSEDREAEFQGLEEKPAQNCDSELPVSKETGTSKQSVLLVDDNDLNLQLLCAYVRKEGHEYMTAKDGAEAVEIFKAHPGKFQVVIIDISMPVMDGFEASRQIRRFENARLDTMSESEREANPHTLIAALTGLDSASAQNEALGSGINTFLIKPVKRPDLLKILRHQI
ncbi:hypothetical protein N7512_003801 [Penicillium capsulatum]|nr:hypothetical protein N7512_003801 [Penicillium capsulatum]